MQYIGMLHKVYIMLFKLTSSQFNEIHRAKEQRLASAREEREMRLSRAVGYCTAEAASLASENSLAEVHRFVQTMAL